MYRRSKSCRKVPERTMTRSDIFKLVQGIRTKKHRDAAPSDELSDKSEGSRSQDPSSEDLDSKEMRSGLNVCIFPCNNPIEHVIAECYRHAKHGRGLSTENSQSAGSEELSLSTCENLLSQVAKKIEELQNEMKHYQTQNEHLKNLQQHYHQMLSKLQKEKDEFEAHKEKETAKLRSEIEEEKRKIRRQRHRQNVSIVAKAEMKHSASAAKDKDKEAQSQIQRKVNLLTSENGRLKDKLQLADQEKDSLKAMVKELEEQRIALLEKMSELKRYPSLNELSPASHFVMPMPSSPFQADGAQLALESAHGDSICMEAKNRKETVFDIGSTGNPDATSEPSVVMSATVVARLSLDSTSDSIQKPSKTVSFAEDVVQTSQSASSVLDSIGATTAVEGPSDQSVGQGLTELCISYREMNSLQKLRGAHSKEMTIKNDNLPECISKVTKVGRVCILRGLVQRLVKRAKKAPLRAYLQSPILVGKEWGRKTDVLTLRPQGVTKQIGTPAVVPSKGSCPIMRSKSLKDLTRHIGNWLKILNAVCHMGSEINIPRNGDYSEWESYEEPEQSLLVYGTQAAKDTEHSEVERENQITQGSARNGHQKAEEAGSSLQAFVQGGQCLLQAPKAMSQCFLQDRQASQRANLWKRHLSTDKKASSLGKKYSPARTSNEDASDLCKMTKARKSQSAQIQSSSLMRDHSLDKHSSRTWALDSNGHKMLLTVVSKEIDPFTQVIVYHYAKSRTVHSVYPCGKKEIKFANGQVEMHSVDGNVEVTYPDGTVRRILCTGEEEQKTPDGIVARRLRDGTETIDYPNGQKEVRSELYRSRYYPNGTVKTVYMDGKQVTRYPNGRVRVKEADGTVRG
ncbi:hypothetical protein MTO96_000472 [Rhipicephalus appendiculatus]